MSDNVTITYKGQKRSVPKTYLGNLKGAERQKQIKSIFEGTMRPKTSYKSKRSSWVEKFEKKYGTKISDKKFVHKNIISKKGADEIIAKGQKAFFTSGSRPNQTPYSWGLSRLASVIMGGPSRRIDKDIWEKYKK
jgi:hypothetical protein